MLALTAVAAIVLGLGAPQDPPAPQTAPPTAPVAQTPQTATTDLGDVIVEGHRTLEETVHDFVDVVVEPPRGRGPARWDRTVCVGVANLRTAAAQVMIDRISQVAMDVGLEPGEPGCKPNVLVIATADGQGLARGLVDARRRAFLPGAAGASRSTAQLEAFENSDKPVRWWHVSLPVVADTGAPAVRMPGESAPTVSTLGSRLTSPVRNDLRRVFIIVDFEKLGAVNFQQLSDYVAMVALAQVDPDADTASYRTILNVFADPQAESGLTDFDMDYLKSLYTAELNQLNPTAQSGEIGGSMVRRQRGVDTPPAH